MMSSSVMATPKYDDDADKYVQQRVNNGVYGDFTPFRAQLEKAEDRRVFISDMKTGDKLKLLQSNLTKKFVAEDKENMKQDEKYKNMLENMDKLGRQVPELQTRATQLEQEKNKIEEEYSNLKTQANKIETQHSDLQTKVEELEKEKVEIEEILTESKSTIEKTKKSRDGVVEFYQAKLVEIDSKLSVSKVENEELSQNLKQVKKSLVQKEEMLEKFANGNIHAHDKTKDDKNPESQSEKFEAARVDEATKDELLQKNKPSKNKDEKLSTETNKSGSDVDVSDESTDEEVKKYRV